MQVCIIFELKRIRNLHFSFYGIFPGTYCSKICEKSIFIAYVSFHVKHILVSVSLHELSHHNMLEMCNERAV